MSQSLQALLQRMSKHEIEFLKTVCEYRREAQKFHWLIEQLRVSELDHSLTCTKFGISQSQLSHAKERLYHVALDSISFYQHLVTYSRRPPSPEARCMRSLRQAQMLRERKLISDAHNQALKASKIADQHGLSLHQTMADEFLATTKRTNATTTATALYSEISTKTANLSQYYALQSTCFELVEHSPFTPKSTMDSKRFDNVIALAVSNLEHLDSRTKAQLLLTQLWNLQAKPVPDTVAEISSQLDALLTKLKDKTASNDWQLLNVLKVAGETMHQHYDNVPPLAEALSAPTAVSSPLIALPLRRMTEHLILQKQTAHLLPIVESMSKNAGHYLLAYESQYWVFLKGAVFFCEGEYKNCRKTFVRITGVKTQVYYEMDLINLMCVFELGDYLLADVIHEAFRKRILRGAKRYKEHYGRIATLFKFLIRVGFKERSLQDLEEGLIERNSTYAPTQLEYFEFDFDTWFWEKLDALEGGSGREQRH